MKVEKLDKEVQFRQKTEILFLLNRVARMLVNSLVVKDNSPPAKRFTASATSNSALCLCVWKQHQKPDRLTGRSSAGRRSGPQGWTS